MQFILFQYIFIAIDLSGTEASVGGRSCTPIPPPLTGSYYIMEPTVTLNPWSWLLGVVHQAQKPSFSHGELKREGDEETDWRSLAIEGWATLINLSAFSFLPLSGDESRPSPPLTLVAVCTWIKRKKYHKIIQGVSSNQFEKENPVALSG